MYVYIYIYIYIYTYIRIKAWLEGEQVANVLDTSLPFGQVALGCGYHR